MSLIDAVGAPENYLTLKSIFVTQKNNQSHPHPVIQTEEVNLLFVRSHFYSFFF